MPRSTSEDDCIRIVKSYVDKHPFLTRICGMGWFPVNWNDAPLPTKNSLDRVFPDRPVYLMCADAHTAWLNSKALEECGVTRDTVVECGEICKDEHGEPNGILKEAASIKLAFGKTLCLPEEILKEIQIDFLKQIAENGVTSVGDMSAYDMNETTTKMFYAAKELEKQALFTTRLNLYPNLIAPDGFGSLKDFARNFDSGKIRIAGLKQFVDGVTTTYTGFLLGPYADKPEITGYSNYPPEVYKKYIIEANLEGFGVRLHCIGDAAVRLALDAFEEANTATGNKGNRLMLGNTIEHCENVHPDDIPRFAELGVIPSLQPLHLTLDANEKIGRIGLERCRYEWPHRSLIDSGAVLAAGTDYPVVGFNPFPNIYAAVSRCDEKGIPTGVNPEERITLREILSAYTRGSACAYGMQNELGTLEIGKLADVVVVNRNLFAIPEYDIRNCKVELTIVDGKVIFER